MYRTNPPPPFDLYICFGISVFFITLVPFSSCFRAINHDSPSFNSFDRHRIYRPDRNSLVCKVRVNRYIRTYTYSEWKISSRLYASAIYFVPLSTPRSPIAPLKYLCAIKPRHVYGTLFFFFLCTYTVLSNELYLRCGRKTCNGHREPKGPSCYGTPGSRRWESSLSEPFL